MKIRFQNIKKERNSSRKDKDWTGNKEGRRETTVIECTGGFVLSLYSLSSKTLLKKGEVRGCTESSGYDIRHKN